MAGHHGKKLPLDEIDDNPEISKPWRKKTFKSFSQDIVYAVSQGRVRPLKHTALTAAVKNLTGSPQIDTMLDRFRHCMSNKEVLKLEQDFMDEQHAFNTVVVPSNIVPQLSAGTIMTSLTRLPLLKEGITFLMFVIYPLCNKLITMTTSGWSTKRTHEAHTH